MSIILLFGYTTYTGRRETEQKGLAVVYKWTNNMQMDSSTLWSLSLHLKPKLCSLRNLFKHFTSMVDIFISLECNSSSLVKKKLRELKNSLPSILNLKKKTHCPEICRLIILFSIPILTRTSTDCKGHTPFAIKFKYWRCFETCPEGERLSHL